ncbi:MAG: galactose-1-epimerase, partial [Cyanobacteria bacterium SIG32]|nr:galactose-1-epimerase [Cyanobacteria bacterium SIG32]
DMESGYPGNVQASVIYKFDNNNNLHIQYKATTDKDTLINMTNHTYFNLDGAENTQEGSVLDHIVTLPNSSSFTQNSEIAIPTGEIVDVENTPFDFKTSKRIGDVISSDYEQIKIGSGFDQNYCIDNYDGKSLIEVADVKSQKTGINLKVSTNLPGFQFYTANHLGKSAQPNGKSGTRYEKRSAFCVEPQFYPNAVNTESFKEKGILKAGEEYNREIVYSFSVNK